MRELQPILTITGSDSTGGSGVQADIKTISELGGYAVSAITSITVQNTLGIQEFFDVPAEIVSGQIEAIMNDIQPSVVKVGMIRKVETLDVIIDALTKYRPDYIVYAPAIWSSNGDALMTEDVVSQIKYRLLPLCSAVVARKKENDIMLQDSKLLRRAEDGGLCVFMLDNANSHGLINRFSSALAVRARRWRRRWRWRRISSMSNGQGSEICKVAARICIVSLSRRWSTIVVPIAMCISMPTN